MSLKEDQKAALFGKITASATHEFQNVLAIIRESAGLMTDIMVMTPAHETELLAERLAASLDTINRQVARGVELISCLNGFAHSADHVRIGTDFNLMGRRFVALMQRLAAGAGMTLEMAETDRELVVETDPVQWQVCLFHALMCLFEALPTGTVFTLRLPGAGEAFSLEIHAAHTDGGLEDLDDKVSGNPEWTAVTDAALALDIQVELKASLIRFIPA